MIRIYINRDDIGQDGGTVIYVTGHANAEVCAGISAIVQTMIAGFYNIEKSYPRQLSVTGLRSSHARKKTRKA